MHLVLCCCVGCISATVKKSDGDSFNSCLLRNLLYIMCGLKSRLDSRSVYHDS